MGSQDRLLPFKVPNPREREASFCPGKARVRFPPLSLPSGRLPLRATRITSPDPLYQGGGNPQYGSEIFSIIVK